MEEFVMAGEWSKWRLGERLLRLVFLGGGDSDMVDGKVRPLFAALFADK